MHISSKMGFTKLGQQTSSFTTITSSKRRPLIRILFLNISFLLVFLSFTFFPNPQISDIINLHTQSSQPQTSYNQNKVKQLEWLKVIHKNHITPNKTLKLGLINFNDAEQSHLELGGTVNFVKINFESVSSNITWEQLFPEWINEKRPRGSCPEIPILELGKYSGLDVIVAQLPCMELKEEMDINGNLRKEGIRDVNRLQISLITANLIVENGINNKEKDIYAVFIGKCEPMVEIFRCEDMLWHKGEYWVYKPNLDKLKEMIRMPVGICALANPYVGNSGSRQLQANAIQLPQELQFLSRTPNTYTPREAYVTVLHSKEDYVCGAIALAQSILRTNTTKDLVLLADHTISYRSVLALQAAGWKVKRIERIKSPISAKKGFYNKWNYSKLRIWELVEYDKLMFIDSDFIVLKNIDHFFKYPQLSASPNNNWLFNSGIMILEPSQCFFDNLMRKRYTLKSYNGGDQGYLNEVLTWWHRLTLKLNFLKYFSEEDEKRVVPKGSYTIHFLGIKPWLCYKDYDCNWDTRGFRIYASDEAHSRWYKVYDSMPKKLQKYCGMTRKQDVRVRNRKERARKANFSDGHWKIKIKDPRQNYLVESL